MSALAYPQKICRSTNGSKHSRLDLPDQAFRAEGLQSRGLDQSASGNLRQKAYCCRIQLTRKLTPQANSRAIALVKPSRLSVARVKARRNTALDLTGSLLSGSALTLPISWAAKLLSIARQRMKRMSHSGLVEAHKAVPSELVLRGGAGI